MYKIKNIYHAKYIQNFPLMVALFSKKKIRFYLFSAIIPIECQDSGIFPADYLKKMKHLL